MIAEWIRVESYKDVPNGDWLVELENDKKLRTMNKEENFTLIGDHFAFDQDRVVGYTSLPTNRVGD